MRTDSAKRQLIVGTAGHIDHGKSRLVWTLTGVDPDRLPEEKARGMTIDLGFAHLRREDADLWFVDVPGHERFIRNMVAGAVGVDLALLVVAADDGIMPQTREHAQVLSLLGVERVIVVLTKCDLVDAARATTVEGEVRTLARELGLTVVTAVQVSAQSGQGIDALRETLAGLARPAEAAGGPGWFRMPIDRAFSVAGRGLVVSGSVAHGRVEAGDELELWPAGRRVRARELQSHSESRAAAGGRLRLAINLAGVDAGEVTRGHTLASPGYLAPGRFFDVRVTALRMPGKARRRALRLRLHIGTFETLAELRLSEAPAAEEIRGVFAQLVASEPIVSEWGERFLLRDEAGMRTLGGGRILCPSRRAWSQAHPPDPDELQGLLSAEPRERLAAVLRIAGWNLSGAGMLAARAGLASASAAVELAGQLVTEGEAVAFDLAGTTTWVSRQSIDRFADFVDRRLRAHLAQNPRLPGIPRGEWGAWMPRECPVRLRPALAEWMIRSGRVQTEGQHVVPRGHVAALPPADHALYVRMLAEFEESGFQPPAVEALRCHTAQNSRRLSELVRLAAARGQIVRVADGVWLAERLWREGVSRVVGLLRRNGKATVAELRDLLTSSRKFVVPFCEALDAAGITRRMGDVRQLGPKAPAPSGDDAK